MKMRILFVVVAAFVICGAAVAWSQWPRSGESPTKPSSDESTENAANENVVSLSDEKLKLADLRVEPASRAPMQAYHLLKGRIDYDKERRVEIKAAAGGILVEIRVVPGQRVTKGQALAVLSSPEIGQARVEVHHAEEHWMLATQKRDWEREISKNVFALIDCLTNRLPIDEVEKRFKGKTLGKSRDVLISAYSRCSLAEKLSKNADAVGADVLSAKTLEERQAERRSAQAALLAACEQASFDVMQEKTAAEIEEEDAIRKLNIAKEHLTTLLNYSGVEFLGHFKSGEELSRVEIRSPIDGTVEERHGAVWDRIRSSDTLLVVADTKTLWVAADVRERDWRALALTSGRIVTVETPAMPGQRFEARVKFVGRQVDKQTNAIPLVAEIANNNGLLRPGLFVNVSIPVGPSQTLLCVPAAALVSHDNVKFLFVRENPNVFRRVDVVTGMETDNRVEIVRGITEGTPVVTRGSALLKAELLIDKLSKED